MRAVYGGGDDDGADEAGLYRQADEMRVRRNATGTRRAAGGGGAGGGGAANNARSRAGAQRRGRFAGDFGSIDEAVAYEDGDGEDFDGGDGGDGGGGGGGGGGDVNMAEARDAAARILRNAREKAAGGRRAADALSATGNMLGDDAAADVVMDVERAPLAGYEWLQSLEPAVPSATASPAGGGGGGGGGGTGRRVAYCYVCNTPPNPEDHALARVTSIFARTRDMDDERIVNLVYAIYEKAIRFTGARPRPEWTRASILAHMKYHAPTPESIVMEAVRITRAMLVPFVMTARRVDPVTRRELPPDSQHTRAALGVLGMQVRTAHQLAGILERANAAGKAS